MQQNNETIWVGFITYGETTLKYLPYFLDSLACQTDVTLKIVCVDNTDGPSANLDYLADRREVEVISKGSNQGFGKAYNIMLTAANKAGAEYFFIVNPDVILAPDCLKRLIVALQKNQALSSVCPKLRRWDFEKKDKTEFIDSCGIVLRPSLQFFDLGQGEIDKGQYDSAEILGPSGAAGLFKMSALNSIKEGEQYFDEHFFMYKEDCDLTMRLNLKGGKSELVPLALAYHDRTASGFGEGFLARINARRSKSRQVRSWSFVNQQMIYCKYWRVLSFSGKLKLIKQQLFLLAYLTLFEPSLLLDLPDLAKKRRGLVYYK